MSTPHSPHTVTGCLLAGGEGRRMGGRDKGLVSYQGRPLAAWVIDQLVSQTNTQFAVANRNLPEYAALLQEGHASLPCTGPSVIPDASDLPLASGPVAGIISALRHTQTPWLMVAPCDTPHLPPNLVSQLLAEARSSDAEAVVPVTVSEAGEERMHWACVLLHKRVFTRLEQIFAQDERKLRVCIQALNWKSVFFPHESAFENINSMETLNGRD